MDRAKLIDAVVKLSAARDVLDAGFESDDRPWSATVNDFADAAYEHADRALDAAIIVAIGSGVTVAELEAVTGHAVVKPNWFED